ncbi:DUF397 domain-containing protein [Actinoplanes sp. NPDC051861]|uniref:DUF397 domain-containing protein n=1 Tax=Actinoplanes sp. NPDC051861 TaxID=3155170 RepID=UPI0034498303
MTETGSTVPRRQVGRPAHTAASSGQFTVLEFPAVGATLVFTHAEWRAFVAGVRDGEFDV